MPVFLKLGLVALAFSFHTSAIVLLAFLVYGLKISPVLRYLTVLAVSWLVYLDFSQTEEYRAYEIIYLAENLESPGAVMHVILNAFPAALYFIFRKRMRQLLGREPIFELLCALSLLALPALLVSSTGADRLALYFSAVQMAVVSALPRLPAKVASQIIVHGGILVYLSLVLFVWLNFANSARAYIPYGNVLGFEWIVGA